MIEKVAIFGGAFDPPHRGHEALVKYVLENTPVDTVLIMPCGIHRIKHDIKTAAQHRLEMTKRAFADMAGVQVSALDMSTEVNSDDALIENSDGSTWQLVQKLRKNSEKSDREIDFFIVIGQDNAETIESWYNWRELLKTEKFIVVPRNSIKAVGKWYCKEPNIFLDKFALEDISSTELRNGEKLDYVKPEVSNYFHKHRLYE